MKRKKWPAILISLTFVSLLLAGFGAVLAAQGSSDDPLVSLSYLTKKLTPSVLQQVDQKVAAQQSALKEALDTKIQQFSDELGSGTPGQTFVTVTLPSGKTLKGSVGTQVLLRSGTGLCVAASAPGLIDTTDGGSIGNSAALAANHLYLMAADGRGVKASGGPVTLLVRGAYTIS